MLSHVPDVRDVWMPAPCVRQVCPSAIDLCDVYNVPSAIRNVPDRYKALESIARFLRPLPSPLSRSPGPGRLQICVLSW